MRFAAAMVFLPLAACQAPVPAAPAEAAGRGLLQADATAPAGVATFERPEWQPGDRFELLRGQRQRASFTVIAADADGYTLDTGLGMLLKRDRDLGNRGEWRTNGDAKHLLSPVDRRYHWPLWVGKAWSCEFVDQPGDGGKAMTMQADYVVEGLDRIIVPAGAYDALRIVRRVRLLGQGDEFLTRAQITWYAPAIGTEVRQLVGDSLVELAAVERRSLRER
jgi:hypothetical protein